MNPRWIATRFTATSLREPQVATVRPVLLAVGVSVVVLLAMACLNVASLMLIQARRDTRMMALRAAVGADPGRLVAEEAVRHALLTLGSGALGVVVSIPLVRLLVSYAVIDVPGFAVELNLRVILFAGALALLVTLAVGLLPALAVARAAPAELLDRARGSTSGRLGRRLHNGVVAGQVAMGAFLLVAAWAMTAHVARLQRGDPGYRVDDILTARIGASDARFPDLDARVRFVDAVTERLGALPGVVSVGATSSTHVGDLEVYWSFSIEDRPPTDASEQRSALGRMVDAGYLETMGIGVLEGRGIEPGDRADAEPVVVVNRAFADTYWPGERALGKRIKRRTWDSPFPWLRVVGVVEDVREHDLAQPFVPTIYFPYAQHFTPSGSIVTLVLRTSGEPGRLANGVRRAVAGVDPNAAVFRVLTMRERLGESLGQRRLGAVLLGSFGVLGLVLSLVGIYGVVSEAVARRRREVGVRVALGATPSRVLRAILGQAALLALVGTGAASLAIHLVTPGAERLFPGLTIGGPRMATVCALLTGAVLVAALVPALRAARTDVVRVLTEE